MTIVIDIVQIETVTKDNKKFYGLYNATLPKNCWTSDGKLVLYTNQKNTVQSYIIDLGNLQLHLSNSRSPVIFLSLLLDEAALVQIGNTADSFIVCGVYNDVLVMNRRNFLKPDMLLLGKIENSYNTDSIKWQEVTPQNRIPGLENCVYHYLDLIQESDKVSK